MKRTLAIILVMLSAISAMADSIPSVRVINKGNDKGFVFVSGEEGNAQVLGYSDTGNIDVNNLPDGLKFYLEACKARVENEGQSGRKNVQRAKGSTVPVAPMLTTTWKQDSPYNNACPNGSEVGCTAIALAQVLRYHVNSATCSTTIPGYTTRTNGYVISDITGARTYNWNNMPNSINVFSSSAAKEAISQFVYHVGVSIKTDYGSESGAVLADACSALTQYFGMTYTSHFYVSNTTDYIARLDASLDAGHPVCISGFDSKVGHTFVCDGRNSEGLYHINWGWGGQCDGYYDIDNLNPSNWLASYAFNSDVEMLTGIRIQGTSSTSPLQDLTALYNICNGLEFHCGSAPGLYSQETVDALQSEMTRAKTVLDNSSSYTTSAIAEAYSSLNSRYEAAMNSRAYPDGYYHIVSTLPFSSKKAIGMMPGTSIMVWNTLDNNDNNYLWKLEYDRATKSYACHNVANGGSILDINQEIAVHTGSDESLQYFLSLDSRSFDETMDCYNEAIHHYNSTATYGYLHPSGHGNGSGMDGYVIGWSGTEAASLWRLELVEEFDETAEDRKVKMQNLIAAAESIYNDEKPAEAVGLITSVDQLSSPYTDPSEGSLAELLDGSSSTFWHSNWQGGDVPEGTHYLQVDLTEALEGDILLSMTRRSTAKSDHITQFLVKASITPDEEASWSEVATVDLPYSSNNEKLERTFTLPEAYRYLRFYIMDTKGEVGDRGYGHMGEFQLYEAPDGDQTEKLAELEKAITTAKAATRPSEGDIKALQAAIRAFFGNGDVNADHAVTISDVVRIIEVLNGRATDTLGTADLDGSGTVTRDDMELEAGILINK